MTRTEHLEFCRKCLEREFDSRQGIVCSLTQKIADFDGTCPNFKIDETVSSSIVDNEEAIAAEVFDELDVKAIKKLRDHQDFYYAIIGGVLATMMSAVLWAVITVTTQFQIGFMAVGVGLVVGFTIRFFGAGIDKKFGYLGAFLSLIGCLAGNLFTQVGFIAQAESLGYFETLTYLNFGLIIDILIESFNPMDLLFYGIAVYEGYRFAFRNISVGLLSKLKSGDYDGIPSNHKLRLPLVIGSIVILSFFVFKMNQGVSGFKTYHYESGIKMSEGELKNNKESGKWTFWYENGKTQSIGFFIEGIPDSLWQWYDDQGQIMMTGHYENGLEHGTWENYYSNGLVSDSGSYLSGRMHGLWKYWFESGDLQQVVYFKRNIPDGTWITYHENGQLESEGEMNEGIPIGDWKTYYDNSQIAEEIFYETEAELVINNVWDRTGNQLVINGYGSYKSFSETGQVMQSGVVEQGIRVGKWSVFFENGSLQEEGSYTNDLYKIHNSWDWKGKQNVNNGFGTYYTFYDGGELIYESGNVKNGFRDGLWKLYYETSGNIYLEQRYIEGKLTGLQNSFYESGQIFTSGEMVDGFREGEWIWYHENGIISSKVNFAKDKKIGNQIIWSELGIKSKEEYYENGVLTEEKTL
jgi:antitoxin component YwqK of YwqJK toxin-antitoxin module